MGKVNASTSIYLINCPCVLLASSKDIYEFFKKNPVHTYISELQTLGAKNE